MLYRLKEKSCNNLNISEKSFMKIEHAFMAKTLSKEKI